MEDRKLPSLSEYDDEFSKSGEKDFYAFIDRKKQEALANGEQELAEHLDTISNQAISKTNEDRFLNDIKVDNSVVSKEIKMRNFLEEIDGNKEALNKLSIDRLRKLEKYYADVIKENEKKIIQANG